MGLYRIIQGRWIRHVLLVACIVLSTAAQDFLPPKDMQSTRIILTFDFAGSNIEVLPEDWGDQVVDDIVFAIVVHVGDFEEGNAVFLGLEGDVSGDAQVIAYMDIKDTEQSDSSDTYDILREQYNTNDLQLMGGDWTRFLSGSLGVALLCNDDSIKRVSCYAESEIDYLLFIGVGMGGLVGGILLCIICTRYYDKCKARRQAKRQAENSMVSPSIRSRGGGNERPGNSRRNFDGVEPSSNNSKKNVKGANLWGLSKEIAGTKKGTKEYGRNHKKNSAFVKAVHGKNGGGAKPGFARQQSHSKKLGSRQHSKRNIQGIQRTNSFDHPSAIMMSPRNMASPPSAPSSGRSRSRSKHQRNRSRGSLLRA